MVACELASLRNAEEARGAASFLAWLRANDVRVGIVTRNSRAAVAMLLSHVPLPHDVLLTRNDVPRPKPDPHHLHLALERHGVACADAVLVGDLHMDIVAGRAAGVRAVAIAHAKLDEAAFARCPPERFVRSFDDLKALFTAR